MTEAAKNLHDIASEFCSPDLCKACTGDNCGDCTLTNRGGKTVECTGYLENVPAEHVYSADDARGDREDYEWHEGKVK